MLTIAGPDTEKNVAVFYEQARHLHSQSAGWHSVTGQSLTVRETGIFFLCVPEK